MSERPRRGSVGAWLLLAAVGEASCHARTHEERGTGSAASSGNPGAGGPSAPRVVCDEPTHDFGPIVQGDRLTHVFRIRNAGSAALHIAAVDRAYGCDVPSPPASIEAGQGADLDVVCETDERTTRMVDKLVLHSDDLSSPELVLELQATVEPLLAFTSRTVECELAFGERDTREVRLTGRLASKARLHLEENEPAGPEVTVLKARDGDPPGLRFTFVGATVGHGAGQTRATTGLDKPNSLTVLWSWHVRGNLVVEPTNPYFDLGAAAPAGGVVVQVSSRRDDFRLQQAVVIEGPFEAAFSRAEPPATAVDAAQPPYAVVVRVRESLVPAGVRGVAGKLRLSSNDPAEPQKEVPLFALGAANRSPR